MVSRRVGWTMLLALAIFPIGGVVSSCTLWSDYSDGLTCGKDEDCFRAQGEVCDLAIKQCIAGPQPRLPAPTGSTPIDEPVQESAEVTSNATLPAMQVQP